ncbi:MAG TPA: lycopene cyclase family protein [Candidatus Limnocylindrales bacterium]|nr:lycopene cyclase family protein [Candidatus Limnocylindrales bacterium]
MPGDAGHDHVIVGAGLSGLMLARRLLAGPAPATAPTLLLIDPRTTMEHRVTLAHWARGTTPLDPWAVGSPPEPMTSTSGGRAGGSRRALELYQTFRGVWVQSAEPRVDRSAATLLDFSADDGPDLGFAYVLPVDEHSALVMAVRMGVTTDLPDPVPAIPRELGEDGWEVTSEDRGITALTTPAPARRQGRRVLAIGRRGGRVRASTGYAVTRILADSDAIVSSLHRHGHPFGIPPDPWQDRALDAIWLHALAGERAALEPAFLSMFSGVPIDAVLRFLDGRAGAADLTRVVTALPPRPFLRAAARLAVGRPATARSGETWDDPR